MCMAGSEILLGDIEGRQSVNLPREGSQWEQHPLDLSALKRGAGSGGNKMVEEPSLQLIKGMKRLYRPEKLSGLH